MMKLQKAASSRKTAARRFSNIQELPMRTQINPTPQRFTTVTVALALLVTFTMLAGCAGSHVRFRHDPDMTRAFQEGEVLDGHRYYITGRDQMPYAIVALQQPYRQASTRWREITPSSSQLAYLSNRLYRQIGGYDARASAIIAPTGERIGYYYSTWYQTAVRMISETEIAVYSPYMPGGRYAVD
jgi:hypothetical protein